LREEVLSSAKILAGDVSNAAASLNAQSLALGEQASGVTSQVNSLTTAVAQLNQQIATTSPNADAGTLEDQRQQDLSQLSQLIGINQVKTENNGLSVTTTSGQLLVDGGTSFQMSSGPIAGATHFFVGSADITGQLASGGGQLGGTLMALTQDIPNALTSLNELAYGISTSVNALNNSGTNLDGNTGSVAVPIDIFSQPTSVDGSAVSMSVVMTDPNQIAAAALGLGTGDNSNSSAMANLSKQLIVNGQKPTDFYSSFVSTLGATVSGVEAENTAENASVTQLQSQNNALSGVNLNDEAAAMSKMESSYQAASQVFNMLDKIMTSALNLGQETAVS
jgi:flagellar hook-associated protein 1 FlgK